jgi:type I restriction enzyme S subunit
MKQGWEIRKLGEFANIKSGKSIDANQILDNISLYPCYGGNGIRGYVKNYRYNGYFPVIGRVGALCGNVHLAKGQFNATEHALIVEIKNEDINPEWLTYNLISLKLRGIAKGVAQPVIAASEVAKIPISVPPLPEQERIVAELDCLSSVIEKQKELLNELDNLAQSIFYTTFGDPTSNNFGWKNRRLGEVVNSNMIGLTRSGSEQDASYEYLYFKMNNIGNKGGVDWSKTTRVNACAKEVEKYILKEGDFLFNTRNSFELVGKTCVYPHIDSEVCLFNNNVMRIDFKKEINVTYMAYLFQDTYIKNQLDRIKKGTTSVWAIYYKDLEKISILVPDIALQEEFASKVTAIEKQKELIKQSIAETETLFNSRMDYYFN